MYCIPWLFSIAMHSGAALFMHLGRKNKSMPTDESAPIMPKDVV